MLFSNGQLGLSAVLAVLASTAACSPIYSAAIQHPFANSSSSIYQPTMLSPVSPSFRIATIVETPINTIIVTESVRVIVTVTEIVADDADLLLSLLSPSLSTATIVETAIDTLFVTETFHPTVTVGVATEHAETASTLISSTFDGFQTMPEVTTIRQTTLITTTMRPTVTVVKLAEDQSDASAPLVSTIYGSPEAFLTTYRPTTVVTTTIHPTITVLGFAADQYGTLSTPVSAIFANSQAMPSTASLRFNTIVAWGNVSSSILNSSTIASPSAFVISGNNTNTESIYFPLPSTSNSSTIASPSAFAISDNNTSAQSRYLPITLSESRPLSSFTEALATLQTSSNTSTSSSFVTFTPEPTPDSELHDAKDRNSSMLHNHGDPHDSKAGNIAGEAIGGVLAFYWLIHGAKYSPLWEKLIPKPLPSGEDVPINWLRKQLGQTEMPKWKNWSYKFPTLPEGVLKGVGDFDPVFPDFYPKPKFDVSKLNNWVNRFPKKEDWQGHMEDFIENLKSRANNHQNSYTDSDMVSHFDEWGTDPENISVHYTSDEDDTESDSENPDSEELKTNSENVFERGLNELWRQTIRGDFGLDPRIPAWLDAQASRPPASGPLQVDAANGEPIEEPIEESDESDIESITTTQSLIDLLIELANDITVPRLDMGPGKPPFIASDSNIRDALRLPPLREPVRLPGTQPLEHKRVQFEELDWRLSNTIDTGVIFEGKWYPTYGYPGYVKYHLSKYRRLKNGTKRALKKWWEEWTNKLKTLTGREIRPWITLVSAQNPWDQISYADLVGLVEVPEAVGQGRDQLAGAMEELGSAVGVTGTKPVFKRVATELPQGVKEITSGLTSAVANLEPASNSGRAALDSGLALLSTSIKNLEIAPSTVRRPPRRPATVGRRNEVADVDATTLKFATDTIRLQQILKGMRTSFAEFATMVDSIEVTDAWQPQFKDLQSGLNSTLSWFDRLTGWKHHEVEVMEKLLQLATPPSPPSSLPSSLITPSPPAPSISSPAMPPGAPLGHCSSHRDESGIQHIHFSLSVDWPQLKQAANSCGILDGTWQNHKVTANGKTDSVAVFDLPALVLDTCPNSIRQCLDLAPHPTTTEAPATTVPDRHSVYWRPTDAAGLAAYPTASPHAECNYWVTPQKGISSFLATPPVTYEIFHMSEWRDTHNDPVKMLNALKTGVLSLAALDVADWRMGNDSQSGTPFAYFQWHNVYSVSDPSHIEGIVRDVGGQADMKCVRREDKSFGDLKVSHVPFSSNDGVVGNAWEGYIGDVPIGRDGYGGAYRV